MDKAFHYSFNSLSIEQQSTWNEEHTIQERMDQRRATERNALEQVPEGDLPKWVIVNQFGVRWGSLHDVYIAFPISWLFTKTGRRRRPSRALRMMGVPFVKHNGFDVVSIVGLN